MCEDVSVYINHLRAKKVNNPGSKMMLESRVVMSSVGDDVYGTGDAITLIPQMRKNGHRRPQVWIRHGQC